MPRGSFTYIDYLITRGASSSRFEEFEEKKKTKKKKEKNQELRYKVTR